MTDHLKELESDLQSLIPSLKIETTENRLVIEDFCFDGLKIMVDNRVVFYFKKLKELDPDDLSLYLQVKLPMAKISNKYLSDQSFYLYPNSSFNSDKKGVWQKKMWIIRLIRDAHEALEGLKKELELNPEK